MLPRRHILYLPGYMFARHHQGIVRYARQAGWTLNASMAYTGKIPETRDYDGILSFHSDLAPVIEKIRERPVPTVDLSHKPGDPGIGKVLHNNPLIGRLAGEHLLARGFRRIGYVGWFRGPYDPDRAKGLEDAARRAGAEFFRIPIDGMIEVIRGLPKPLAVMFQNDMHASEGMMRLIAAGFDIPHEIAVIGVDDDPLYCDTAPVPLSSVDSGVEACGFEAAKLLDRMLAGEPAPASPVLAPVSGVVERASTRLIAIEHAPTSRALAFIRGRFRDPIDLDDVARSVGLGRRRLEDHFKIHLGRTMAEELRRLRLEEAARRIAETGDKLADIATACGFTDGAHLTHAFRAGYGETPESYRKRRT